MREQVLEWMHVCFTLRPLVYLIGHAFFLFFNQWVICNWSYETDSSQQPTDRDSSVSQSISSFRNKKMSTVFMLYFPNTEVVSSSITGTACRWILYILSTTTYPLTMRVLGVAPSSPKSVMKTLASVPPPRTSPDVTIIVYTVFKRKEKIWGNTL